MAEWCIRCKVEDTILKHERTGRPLGGDNFLSLLEEKIGRILKNRSQAPKRTIIREGVPGICDGIRSARLRGARPERNLPLVMFEHMIDTIIQFMHEVG